MSPLPGLLSRLRMLFSRHAAEDRISEEFAFHIAMQTDKYVARGMAPDDARRQALLDFGGQERHRETLRDAQRPRLLAEIAQDARFTGRSLRQNRGFAITAVLVVSLGVGATTALFSIANALLFRPLPVDSPDELYVLQEARRGGMSIGMEGNRIPYQRYEVYRESTGDLFDGLAAHVFVPLSMRATAAATAAQGALVSGNYFRVLGLRPAAGRFFTEDDEPVVVLSHRAWQQHFAGEMSAIGRLMYVEGRPYTVAGIAPPGFRGTVAALSIDIWVPFGAHMSADSIERQPRVGMVGRVRDAGALNGTTARLTTIATRMPAEMEGSTVERAYLAPLTGLPELIRTPVRGFIGMLVAAGFLVLMIGAANIAALLLARAVARRREVAVRLALGAGRGRIVRQLLTESTVLFLMGGIGGIAIAYLVTGVVSRISVPGIPVTLDAAPDVRVLAFALGVAALTGILFGLAPALAAVRLQLIGALKDGAYSGGTSRMRARSLFVGAQIAFAVVLLITAGLFVRGLQRGMETDPGFDPAGIVVGTFSLEPYGLSEDRGTALQDELLRRVRALPEVRSASLARTVLVTGSSSSNDVANLEPDTVRLTSPFNIVDTAYFATMGIDIVAGRAFRHTDARGAPPVVIINERLAERLWPGRNPIGRHLRRGQDYEVIGVARNGKYVSLGESPQPFMFFAAAQHYAPSMTVHARTSGNTARVIEAIRQELRAVHPDVALELAMPLERMIAFGLLPQRLAAGLIGAFGVLGLVLAAAGIYGVMAYQVAQRTREFGIRIALGARARDVSGMMLRRGVMLSIGGALAGTAIAVAATRLIAGMLFGVSPLDPVTFGAVVAVLAGVAVIASWVPARRAIRVDPMLSLRAD